jgi:hypothetical protein
MTPPAPATSSAGARAQRPLCSSAARACSSTLPRSTATGRPTCSARRSRPLRPPAPRPPPRARHRPGRWAQRCRRRRPPPTAAPPGWWCTPPPGRNTGRAARSARPLPTSPATSTRSSRHTSSTPSRSSAAATRCGPGCPGCPGCRLPGPARPHAPVRPACAYGGCHHQRPPRHTSTPRPAPPRPSSSQVVTFDWTDEALMAQLNGLKAQNPELKTLIAIGGWTFSTNGATSGIFPAVASQAAPRATFVASAVAFARKYGFDGIDIDWEYPADSGQRAAFTMLMQALRDAIRAEAVPAVSCGRGCARRRSRRRPAAGPGPCMLARLAARRRACRPRRRRRACAGQVEAAAELCRARRAPQLQQHGPGGGGPAGGLCQSNDVRPARRVGRRDARKRAHAGARLQQPQRRPRHPPRSRALQGPGGRRQNQSGAGNVREILPACGRWAQLVLGWPPYKTPAARSQPSGEPPERAPAWAAAPVSFPATDAPWLQRCTQA